MVLAIENETSLMVQVEKKLRMALLSCQKLQADAKSVHDKLGASKDEDEVKKQLLAGIKDRMGLTSG